MGAYRSQPDKTVTSTLQSSQEITVASSHMCSWRLYMEDASIAQLDFDSPNQHLFAVFDGHGGAEVARFAKTHFVQQLKANPYYQTRNYQLALQQTFTQIDDLLRTDHGKNQIKHIQQQLLQEDNLPKRDLKQCAGCTVLVCLLTDKVLYVANAGDSKVYMKKNGNFIGLNTIHEPLAPRQKSRIEKAGGFVTEEGRINGCLNVSRALGDFDFKSNKNLPFDQQMIICLPEISIESVEGIEYILIGCDGIWEEKQHEQIQGLIDERIELGVKLDIILQELFNWLICKQQDSEEKQLGKDNMSAILIRFPIDNHKRQNLKIQ